MQAFPVLTGENELH